MSEIKYWKPVQNAWEKMVEVLFRPFQMGKWMLIGFTAFLANCGRESGSGGNSSSGGGNKNYGASSEYLGEDGTNVFSQIRGYICKVPQNIYLIKLIYTNAGIVLYCIILYYTWIPRL